jgi:hypothetical protein
LIFGIYFLFIFLHFDVNYIIPQKKRLCIVFLTEKQGQSVYKLATFRIHLFPPKLETASTLTPGMPQAHSMPVSQSVKAPVETGFILHTGAFETYAISVTV